MEKKKLLNNLSKRCTPYLEKKNLVNNRQKTSLFSMRSSCDQKCFASSAPRFYILCGSVTRSYGEPVKLGWKRRWFE